MTERKGTIYVIDDDESIRDSLGSLLRSVGFVLDIRLPESNGMECQEELKKAGIDIPIIFITAHGDIPMTSRAIKAGAVEFLTKPFQKDDLLEAIRQGLERDRRRRTEQADIRALRQRFEKLTPREREVMDLVVEGLPNKQAASRLGLSEVTVKIHRGHAMQKMEAGSLADLVRMAERLKPLPRR